MKKIILSILVFMFFITLAGCFSVSTISSIELVEQPKTTYSIGEPMGSFTIKLIYNDGRDPLVISSTNSAITVENFSTEVAGTFTAQIKYISSEYSGAPISFQYTVVDLDEIRGSGTEADPYLISTPEHWNSMDDLGQGKYFRLTNDIDFSGKTLEQFAPKDVLVDGCQKVFSATIDGANYSLKNLNLISQSIPYKYKEIFGFVENFTLKNIDIIFSSSHINGVTGIITAGVGNVLFENVNTYGFIKAAAGKEFGNVAAFATHPDRNATFSNPNPALNLTFNNCNNYADLLVGGTPTIAGGFIGYMSGRNATVTFNNCINYGTIEGASNSAGGFIGYISGSSITFSVTNSVNRGKIVKSGKNAYEFSNNEAQIISGYDYSEGSIYEISNIKNGTGFTYTEGRTYIVQYAFTGTYQGGESGHVRINNVLETTDGTYPYVYINDDMPTSYDGYSIDETFVSDVALKYVSAGKTPFFVNKKIVHSSWSIVDNLVVTVFEYDNKGKLTGYATVTKPYDPTKSSLVG